MGLLNLLFILFAFIVGAAIIWVGLHAKHPVEQLEPDLPDFFFTYSKVHDHITAGDVLPGNMLEHLQFIGRKFHAFNGYGSRKYIPTGLFKGHSINLN